MERAAEKEPVTFTDLLRMRFKGILVPVAAFLNGLGLMPNTVTLLGLLGTVVGAYFLAIGNIPLGGIFILVAAPFDAVDGTMARLRGEPTAFGAFIDSVTDRYSELIIYGGLLVYFLQLQNWQGVVLTYLAAAGSLMVSYVRARAQGVGYETKVGLLTRVERFLILIPCLVLNIPIIGMAVMALLTNLTAFQRILHVRSQAYKQMGLGQKK